MFIRTRSKILLACLLGLTCAAPALAQAPFPSKPIRFMIPFTAGSATDILARTVGESMSKSLGQPIVVENRPGAGGTIAAAQVAKGDADGHLLLVHSSGHALNPAIYPNLPYDTLKDLTGITALASLPNVMVVSPAKGWKSIGDVIAAAKAKPGSFNYASAGTGSATHLNGEKFKLRAGIDAVHIPFKGTPEAITEIIGGRIDWFFAPLASSIPLIREGKVMALAVSTPKRAAALPDVPTTVEAGLPDSSYIFWVGIIAPAGVPAAVQKRLNEEAHKALASPDVRERMARAGADPMPMSIEAFNAFIRSEMESAAQIAKAANLKAQ